MYAFELLRPKTLAEALEALADEEAQALGGGQTLIPTLKARLAMPETLVSLLDVAELRHVTAGDATLSIGAATSHAQVSKEARATYPALADLAGDIGDVAVRTRGTIGGSVANNDPAACYPAAVLASRGVVHTPTRAVAADDFFVGLFETALDEGEIITSVTLEVPKRAAYAKFDQPASRFALVGVFVSQFDDEVRVAVTGAGGDGVFRWTQAEDALTKSFVPEALDGLQLDADDMLSDIHAASDYRAHLVGVMTRRAVEAALA